MNLRDARGMAHQITRKPPGLATFGVTVHLRAVSRLVASGSVPNPNYLRWVSVRGIFYPGVKWD